MLVPTPGAGAAGGGAAVWQKFLTLQSCALSLHFYCSLSGFVLSSASLHVTASRTQACRMPSGGSQTWHRRASGATTGHGAWGLASPGPVLRRPSGTVSVVVAQQKPDGCSRPQIPSTIWQCVPLVCTACILLGGGALQPNGCHGCYCCVCWTDRQLHFGVASRAAPGDLPAASAPRSPLCCPLPAQHPLQRTVLPAGHRPCGTYNVCPAAECLSGKAPCQRSNCRCCCVCCAECMLHHRMLGADWYVPLTQSRLAAGGSSLVTMEGKNASAARLAHCTGLGGVCLCACLCLVPV